MQATDLTSLQTQLEIQYMDALTAAYDADDLQLAEELEDAMRHSSMGVADPESPEGMQAMKDVLNVLSGAGADSAELQAINEQLDALTQGTEYKKHDPMPSREMSATVDDQVELNQKQHLPPAPGISGIC